MASFELKDADVAAVYFRTGRAEKGTEKLRLAPYFLVTYDDGTTGLLPTPDPRVAGGGTSPVYTAADLEVDRIEVYEGHPYEWSQIGFY